VSSIHARHGAEESADAASATTAIIESQPLSESLVDATKLGVIQMHASSMIQCQSGDHFVLVQDAHPSMVRSSAKLSSCRKYRYTLMRTWDESKPSVMFVGLNPSTADAKIDDPTVRRCIGFARRWGFGKLVLTNLFAFRSTDPALLEDIADPVGPENDHWIAQSSRVADLTVVAWGVHGSLLERDQEVLAQLHEPHCLGTTKSGAPRHPLYLPADAPLRLFSSQPDCVPPPRVVRFPYHTKGPLHVVIDGRARGCN
jgi:hypothetical protein